MVSTTHESMHHIFRDHPDTVGGAFRALGFDFPETVATSVLHTDLTEFKPIERRPDSVLHVEVKGGEAFLVVIEAQRRKEASKRRSWPYYLAYLHEYRKLPVVLIVVCQDHQTSAWARETIRIGTDFHTSMSVQPLVLGPHNIPLPEGPITRQDLPLAVLSVITHGREPGVDGMLGALADALDETDETTRTDLALLVHLELGLVNLPAAHTWSKLMSFTREKLRRSPELREIIDESDAAARAEGEAKGDTRGQAKGRAAIILQILDTRRVHLTELQRQRISECTDLATLASWADASLNADAAEQVFRDGPEDH